MEIIDTHTHLNIAEFAEDVDEVIARAYELGVQKMIVVGFDEPSIMRAIELADQYSEIYLTLGWHPTEAGSYNDHIEEQLRQWLAHEKVVALGETGLDYYWNEDPKSVQIEVFRRQIRLAKELDLPFSVHNRESTADVYRVIKEEGVGQAGGIMHSFNLGPEWLEKFVDLGMMISFSGVVTFKNAPEVKESAKLVPLDHFLLETDAPYLSPEPYRGRRNEPGYTYYVAEEIARLRGLSVEDVAEQASENARRLFGSKLDQGSRA